MYTVFLAVGPLILLISLNVIIIYWILSPNRHSDASAEVGVHSLQVSPFLVDSAQDTITLVLVVFLFIFCNSLALVINFLETYGVDQYIIAYLVDLSNLLVVYHLLFVCLYFLRRLFGPQQFLPSSVVGGTHASQVQLIVQFHHLLRVRCHISQNPTLLCGQRDDGRTTEVQHHTLPIDPLHVIHGSIE